MDVSVRKAVAEDADRIARGIFPTYDADGVTENFLSCLKDDRVNIFVAEVGVGDSQPELVGQVQVDLAGPPRTHAMRIYSMVVAEAWRRRGVGKRMMEFIENWGKVEGVELALLEVYPDNEAALRFYTGLGFVKYGLLERGSRFEEGAYKDEILLRKWIV